MTSTIEQTSLPTAGVHAASASTRQVTVAHSIPTWLPETVNWLYNQITHLPHAIETHVVCENVKNLGSFGIANVHCFAQAPGWRKAWDRVARKARIRRHLGFLVQQALRHHVHILHSHFGDVGWANLGAARKARLRHVVTFYGYDVNRLVKVDPRWRTRYQTMFREIDAVLCEGPHMAQCLVNLGCPAGKVYVHHLGVSVNAIGFKPRVWNKAEPLRVLIAATFREKKGIPYALRALAKMRQHINVQVTVIGDATPEPRSQQEKQQILEILERSGLQASARLLGYQPHDILMREAYDHHVFLSPSVTAADGDTEGGAPVALMEMAASGMPIVSTFHCDVPNVVKHGITGLLAPERDVDGVFQQLQWLLDHRESWRPMLDAGRRHIEQEFDVQQQSQKLAALYDRFTS